LLRIARHRWQERQLKCCRTRACLVWCWRGGVVWCGVPACRAHSMRLQLLVRRCPTWCHLSRIPASCIRLATAPRITITRPGMRAQFVVWCGSNAGAVCAGGDLLHPHPPPPPPHPGRPRALTRSAAAQARRGAWCITRAFKSCGGNACARASCRCRLAVCGRVRRRACAACVLEVPSTARSGLACTPAHTHCLPALGA
jgi:hypothetical protein